MTIHELKNLLSRFHIHPRKEMGQNFLLSEQALDEIVAAAELSKEDTVLEIGPGLGILTARLAQSGAKVFAIEKDRKLCVALRKMFKGKKNVKIVNEDALFISDPNSRIASELQEYSEHSGEDSGHSSRYKVVANIPYYITGKLLQNLLELPPAPNRDLSPAEYGRTLPRPGESNNVRTRPSVIVLLLQKEVAERIVAVPGEMSLLSVSVQLYAEAEIVSIVGRENFYPKPEVDSAVIKLKILERPRLDVPEKQFFQLVKIGFSNKRKQLQNNLRALPSDPNSRIHPNDPNIRDIRMDDSGHSDHYKRILADIGLNSLARAQDLSLEDWKKLYDTLTHRSTGSLSSVRGEGSDVAAH